MIIPNVHFKTSVEEFYVAMLRLRNMYAIFISVR